MQEFARDDYSWKRPNRYHLPDFYLPSKFNETIKHLIVGFDLSGSITKAQQRKDLSEIQSLRNTYDLEKLTIYSVDTRVRTKVEVKPQDNILDVKLSGGGGTDFKSFFKVLAKDPPTVLIFFSDLYVNFNFPKPKFDVLWINTDNSKEAPAGYGKTISNKNTR
jgi:predicted metal-dependent peptidase